LKISPLKTMTAVRALHRLVARRREIENRPAAEAERHGVGGVEPAIIGTAVDERLVHALHGGRIDPSALHRHDARESAHTLVSLLASPARPNRPGCPDHRHHPTFGESVNPAGLKSKPPVRRKGIYLEDRNAMAQPFRLAIVGTGQIAAQAHLPAALASPMLEVAAFVDTVPARAETLARDFGLAPRIASDIRDVLERVDGALIATPNHTHRPLAVRCLEAGVHVLIEKPIATSVAEAEDIVRAAEKHDAVAAVGYSTRFQQNICFLKRLIDEQTFGKIERWVYQFGSAGGWEPLSAYHLDRKTSGGGVLVVTGSHFMDRMLYWFGYPDDFDFADDSLGGPEANAVANFRFADGTTGLTRFSKTAAMTAGFVMETERGRVMLRDTETAPVILRPADAPHLEMEVRPQGEAAPGDPFQLQVEDFVEACQKKHAPRISAQQGLVSTRLMEELYACRQELSLDFYQAKAKTEVVAS
jgi:predicted dehydrogenase